MRVLAISVSFLRAARSRVGVLLNARRATEGQRIISDGERICLTGSPDESAAPARKQGGRAIEAGWSLTLDSLKASAHSVTSRGGCVTGKSRFGSRMLSLLHRSTTCECLLRLKPALD